MLVSTYAITASSAQTLAVREHVNTDARCKTATLNPFKVPVMMNILLIVTADVLSSNFFVCTAV